MFPRTPCSTSAFPNLGNFLSQANDIFHDQLKQSPALQQWWDNGAQHNTAQLDTLVNQIHQVSEYLGEEVVVVGVQQTGSPRSTPGFAVVADLQRSGLGDELKAVAPSIAVFDEASLATAQTSAQDRQGLFALVRQQEVVFSSSIAMLKQMNAQLNGTASGFASGDFGQQIAASYGRGAGVILASRSSSNAADCLARGAMAMYTVKMPCRIVGSMEFAISSRSIANATACLRTM